MSHGYGCSSFRMAVLDLVLSVSWLEDVYPSVSASLLFCGCAAYFDLCDASV